MSFNKNITNYFYMNKTDYDLKITVKIDGEDREERDKMMNSLYLDIDETYNPYSIPDDVNSHSTTKIIFLKKNIISYK